MTPFFVVTAVKTSNLTRNTELVDSGILKLDIRREEGSEREGEREREQISSGPSVSCFVSWSRNIPLARCGGGKEQQQPQETISPHH
jgi:hypothetical protein